MVTQKVTVHDEKSELMPEMVSISDLKGHRLTFGDSPQFSKGRLRQAYTAAGRFDEGGLDSSVPSHQGEGTKKTAAISFPLAVAIFSGSGWIPTLPKSNRSASKQASMVGLPVLRVEVC